MIALIVALFFANFFAPSASAFDESVNHAPPFQINQPAPGYCWPSSLAHRILYLKKYRKPPLNRLAVPQTIPQTVKEMANLCHTDLTKGTRQSEKLPCILRYFENNGLAASAFMIGPSSNGLPASAGLHNQLRQVEIADFRKYVKMDFGIILHVGWLKFDPNRKAWVEKASHSLNVYGFDYNESWKDDQIVLKVANPAINYTGRPDAQYYDSVTVTPIERKPGVSYPPMRGLMLHGPGFDGKTTLAVVDDLFIFSP